MTNVDWIAEQLPLVEAAADQPDAVWRSRLTSLEDEAPSPEARESLRAMARSVRAMRQPGVLTSLRMPLDARSTKLLDEVRSGALAELETRLGDSLRATITAVRVPVDPVADGLADADELVESGSRSREELSREGSRPLAPGQLGTLVARELSKPSKPPAWLWSRVRDDVSRTRHEILRFRRSRRLVRWATAAALLITSAVLWPLFATDDLHGDGSRGFDIEIIPVKQPLDSASSPLAILRSARDGR